MEQKVFASVPSNGGVDEGWTGWPVVVFCDYSSTPRRFRSQQRMAGDVTFLTGRRDGGNDRLSTATRRDDTRRDERCMSRGVRSVHGSNKTGGGPSRETPISPPTIDVVCEDRLGRPWGWMDGWYCIRHRRKKSCRNNKNFKHVKPFIIILLSRDSHTQSKPIFLLARSSSHMHDIK